VRIDLYDGQTSLKVCNNKTYNILTLITKNYFITDHKERR